MHNVSPSCSKAISVDKYFFETNLMREFFARSISYLETEGYLESFQMSMTELFWEKTNYFSKKASIVDV